MPLYKHSKRQVLDDSRWSQMVPDGPPHKNSRIQSGTFIHSNASTTSHQLICHQPSAIHRLHHVSLSIPLQPLRIDASLCASSPPSTDGHSFSTPANALLISPCWQGMAKYLVPTPSYPSTLQQLGPLFHLTCSIFTSMSHILPSLPAGTLVNGQWSIAGGW